MNTPNKLTVARMIMVPFFVLFILTGWGGEANRYICLVIFAAASITDWFDGKLARKYNLVTNFGKFMDPLADKLLVCSALICMIELDRLPAWMVIVVIAREFIISGFRLIAAENGVVPGGHLRPGAGDDAADRHTDDAHRAAAPLRVPARNAELYPVAGRGRRGG